MLRELNTNEMNIVSGGQDNASEIRRILHDGKGEGGSDNITVTGTRYTFAGSSLEFANGFEAANLREINIVEALGDAYNPNAPLTNTQTTPPPTPTRNPPVDAFTCGLTATSEAARKACFEDHVVDPLLNRQ